MKISKALAGTLLLAGMTLGTTWAIRGQFGHEQGAAWAGSLGCLGVILLAKRPEWYPKALRAMLAGAIGWGLGGVMSYGLVVGYGRGDDFANVFYGFAMLFIIGGLYGFLGGGLFGLVLEESEEKPVAWPTLLVEMVALAVVSYFFLIMEWEWLMTPPRSELWAACLGMVVALGWFQLRQGYTAAFRVAWYSALGAGFGFALGNFLQVLGQTSGVQFNFWNVMEYSLGFFGGVGMAYGTLTAGWPLRAETKADPRQSGFALFLVALGIPLIVWDQSFVAERLQKTLAPLLAGHDIDAVVMLTQVLALGAIVVAGIFWSYFFLRSKPPKSPAYPRLRVFFVAHWGLYTLCSFLITGALISAYRIEQYLYVVNLVIVGAFLKKASVLSYPARDRAWRWEYLAVGMVILLAVLACVAVSIHGSLKGTQSRF